MKDPGGEGEGLLAEIFKKVKGSSIYILWKREGSSLNLPLISLEGTMKKSGCSSRVETTLAAVAEAQRL